MNLLIEKKSGADLSLFSTMVLDVCLSLHSCSSLPEAVLINQMMLRIKSWQDFMERGTTKLSPQSELGLIGELSCIKDMINLGGDCELIIEKWVGPLRAVQDFMFDVGVIEVKTTTSPDFFDAKINSLDQLDETIVSPLFLLGYRLVESTDGVSINDYVNKNRGLLINFPEFLHKFNSRLVAAGYLDNHSAQYTRKFVCQELLIWEVDSVFPKLSKSNTPQAIFKANYRIHLEEIPRSDIHLSDILVRLGVT
jgi:hypothetical protein